MAGLMEKKQNDAAELAMSGGVSTKELPNPPKQTLSKSQEEAGKSALSGGIITEELPNVGPNLGKTPADISEGNIPGGQPGVGFFETPKAAEPAPAATGVPASAGGVGANKIEPVKNPEIDKGFLDKLSSERGLRGQYDQANTERKLADDLTARARAGEGMKPAGYESGWKPEQGNEYAFRTTKEGGVTKIEGRGLTNTYGEQPNVGLDKKIEELIDRISSQKSLHGDLEITKALIGAKSEKEKAMLGLQGDKVRSEAAFGTAQERAEDRRLAREGLAHQKEMDRLQRGEKATEDTIKLFSTDKNGKQGPIGRGFLKMSLDNVPGAEKYKDAMAAERRKFDAALKEFSDKRKSEGKAFSKDQFINDYMEATYPSE
jgi:hypothetical protein